ncbi:type II toxin-antitoxin system RelE/ParE family toxin [Herbaspirillum rubrisubalbicans]|uniref:Plasmid maintenance system killer protein n=1 Tax=Herbaspirillum rubrisubalbicans TaxID=80842 RepID=A0ABX9C4L1_9BURK|nr:type II toxin-antitoxin system RelE/ParE family toxin [Herbaspirillum rubrisubalbicans]RAM65496.1 plasmid maintenance system killer protein [Herbaspirillum rubrisubalbicans]
MEIEYRAHDLARLETDASFSAGYATAIVTMFRKRIQLIRAADDERQFYALRSLHFEKLQGNRAGQHSMRLNDQWRLILEFKKLSTGKVVVVIEIADYH